MTQFRWGIFGTGGISAKFAAGLASADNAGVAMIASRDEATARTFAATIGAPHAVGGYAEAAARAAELVDAVYIATPPALHYEHAVACLKAGVPVLIEKPFAMDAEQARAIVDAAETHGVFCMEAMWTRFLPALQRLSALVGEGALGEPHLISGSFGISNAVDPDYGNFDPARGGGALAHLGFYPVSLGQWLFGTPEVVKATGTVGATGVDEDVAVALRYASGVTASFQASLRAPADNTLSVHGTHGSLALDGPIYRPYGLKRVHTAPRPMPAAGVSKKSMAKERHLYQRLGVFRDALRGPKRERLLFAGNGYHYQADEVARRVRAGERQSAIMPLSDSIAVAETLDALRAQLHGGEWA